MPMKLKFHGQDGHDTGLYLDEKYSSGLYIKKKPDILCPVESASFNKWNYL